MVIYIVHYLGLVHLMLLRFARKNLRPLSAMTNLTEEQSERCEKTGNRNTPYYTGPVAGLMIFAGQ